MATVKKETAAVNEAEELVEIMIPPTSVKNDPGLFVSVNGVNWLLPRGQKHKVPAYVRDEIERSWKAERALNGMKQELANQTNN